MLPSLIFVPALTQRLCWSESALNISGNITFFAVCTVYLYTCHQQRGLDTWGWGRRSSLYYIHTHTHTLHNRRRLELSGIPAHISLDVNTSSSMETEFSVWEQWTAWWGPLPSLKIEFFPRLLCTVEYGFWHPMHKLGKWKKNKPMYSLEFSLREEIFFLIFRRSVSEKCVV